MGIQRSRARRADSAPCPDRGPQTRFGFDRAVAFVHTGHRQPEARRELAREACRTHANGMDAVVAPRHPHHQRPGLPFADQSIDLRESRGTLDADYHERVRMTRFDFADRNTDPAQSVVEREHRPADGETTGGSRCLGFGC